LPILESYGYLLWLRVFPVIVPSQWPNGARPNCGRAMCDKFPRSLHRASSKRHVIIYRADTGPFLCSLGFNENSVSIPSFCHILNILVSCIKIIRNRSCPIRSGEIFDHESLKPVWTCFFFVAIRDNTSLPQFKDMTRFLQLKLSKPPCSLVF
jgi:hypothetical protein